MNSFRNKVAKTPALWVPSVYFAMGLPMVMISEVSLLMFKDLGIPDSRIAFWTSLLILPWSLKPFFSPAMEVVGSKKQYVVFTELVSALLLGVIVYSLGMQKYFFPLTVLLMGGMALSGSVHDIAGDGTYMHFLDQRMQSRYIGWQGASYNIAKILAKGGLVYLVGHLSASIGVLAAWKFVFLLAAVLLLCIGLYHFFLLPGSLKWRREKVHGTETEGFSRKIKMMWEVIVSFFRKDHILYYLLFILLYRFTEGLAMRIAPLFLKAERISGGLALTNTEFGLIYGTFGTVAFILGSLLSGYYIARYGLRNTLFKLALIFNIPFVVYFLLAYFLPDSVYYVTIGIVLEFFGYGFGFVGLNLFMMQQVAPGPHRMAHYAIGTSLMNLSVVIPGMMSGAISDRIGYTAFFLLALLVAIPGLICTYFLPFTYDDEGKRL